MKPSIWIGIPLFGLGVGFSYLADALIQTQTITPLQTFASIFAAVLFVLFSATMLGIGSGLILHWIFTFGNHWLAFISEAILSFALFFIGIGVGITTGSVWTGAQAVFTFAFCSITLFSLSWISLFGGFKQGLETLFRYFKKRRSKK